MSTYNTEYDSSFWEDIQEAIDWYDEINPGIADKLLNQLDLIESTLKNNPFIFSKVTKSGFRRVLLKKFPYKLYYKISNNTIYIIAFIHSSRSTAYLKRRLK